MAGEQLVKAESVGNVFSQDGQNEREAEESEAEAAAGSAEAGAAGSVAELAAGIEVSEDQSAASAGGL